MKRLLAIATTLFALTFLCAAQAGSSSGGQTGATDQNQGTDKKMHKKGTGGAMLTGCLSGPNSEGTYVLKHGKKEVEVGGNDDLSKHVGHMVKLHGAWAKSGSEIGEKEEAGTSGGKEGKEEKGERHFKVSSIDHVSDTCGGGMEKSKKGSSQPSTPPK